MSARNDGGPAFPLTTPQWHEHLSDSGYPATGCDFTMGMSLRDYFAAKALTLAWDVEERYAVSPPGPTFAGAAVRAYLMADAMLKARQGGAA